MGSVRSAQRRRGMISCNLESPLPPRGTRSPIAKGVRYGNELSVLKVRNLNITHYDFITKGICLALQEYEPRLLRFAAQLYLRISKLDGKAVDVSKLFYLYSFDVMSDLAFGEPLNMLDSDEYHFTVGLLQDGMNLLGPLSPVPWLVRIGYSIPGVAQNFKDLLGCSAQKLRDRMKV
ncbi:hypothetical protein HO173_007052 [Letharia columbiana]|uniref:Uncharacterized protein n=1 Tax=Letharia columbiana TaxID=112416 RepID=A0A8H6FU98_9LECA|nr:uncharacterized protein HO173_007052 [Letharia columbiana]KAF6234832.1 hypothetical protein HO173_007052 [Letharia columbiana]